MDQIVISLISGVVGAMVGGTMTVLGSKKVLTTSMANLERAEIRKLKVECLSNLIGLRFVTPAPTDQLPEYVSKWMFEMNRICVLWSDDPCVMKDLRDFNAEPSNIARLTKLFRTNGQDYHVPFGQPQRYRPWCIVPNANQTNVSFCFGDPSLLTGGGGGGKTGLNVGRC